MKQKQIRNRINFIYFASIKRHHVVRSFRAEWETLMEDLMALARKTSNAITHGEVYSLPKSRNHNFH